MAGKDRTASPDLGSVARPETLTEQTYHQIRRALMSGALSPGEKVSVRVIAKALEVSLTPAREAIGRLVAERVLDLGAHRTVTVPKLDAARYREIMDIRLQLEGLAAERAAPNLGPRQAEKLAALQEDLRDAIDAGDFKRALVSNETFHFTIYRASGMPTLIAMIESLWLQVGPTLNLLSPGYQRSYKGVHHHGSALKAVAAKDPLALREAIERDLTDGSSHLGKLLAEQAAGEEVKARATRQGLRAL